MTTATRAMTFYSTSIGKKAVMAVTGFILFGFVCVHLLGNLQVFQGPEKINAYSALLHKVPALLWLARSVLLVTVLLHLVAGVQLKLQSWRGRGSRYQRFTPVESSIASRWMIWTGLMTASFVSYHLLHLTLGVVIPGFEAHDVYRNIVVGFSLWPISASYILAMALLGLHLSHGLYSMFQSVGWNPRADRWRRAFATGFAIILVAGNVSMPAAVLAGWIQ